MFSNLRVRYRGLKLTTLAWPKTLISWGRYQVRTQKARDRYRGLDFHESKSLPLHLINLRSEPARLKRSIAEIKSLGLGQPERLEGVDGWSVFPELGSEAGRRGCAESHISALKKQLNYHRNEPAIIFEDDIIFVDPEGARKALLEFLGNNAVDVLCIHGFFGRSHKISETLAVSTQISSCAAYPVKPWAVKTLLSEFTKSSIWYDQGFRGARYNVDIAWQPLQWRKLVFAVPNWRVAHQAAGYSQTEARSLKKR